MDSIPVLESLFDRLFMSLHHTFSVMSTSQVGVGVGALHVPGPSER